MILRTAAAAATLALLTAGAASAQEGPGDLMGGFGGTDVAA